VNPLRALALILLQSFILSSSAEAGKLDLLLMPGQLISGHAKFEERCENCHEKLKKANQSGRCLGCHDHADIARDIKEQKGFHGRLAKRESNDCRHCHTDHKGRDRDIVHLDPAAFDHRQTDFQLEGAHRRAACGLCHSHRFKKYSQAPSACFDCHEADDSHKGKLGKECGKCHNEKGWRKQKFDHNKDTKYKLIGRHEKVDCKLCHAGEVYKNTPRDCVSCHLINDSHNGKNGRKCEKCHTSRDWKKPRFNHSRDTKFKLIGRHKSTACGSCHIKGPYQVKLKMDCYSCHEKDDEHNGRNGKDCKKCHNPKGWEKTGFDHAKDTKFPLKGRHEGLVCTACHRSTNMDSIKGSGCIDCHGADDVHKGKQGRQCGDCHRETGWGDRVFFDHGLTRFPLIGLHSVTACEDCHISAEYRDTKRACIACHKQDDAHEGRFTEHCNRCHNPNGWMLWTFDHDKQTDFPLDGAHLELNCHACHRTALERHKRLSRQCFGCHRGDDIHRGSFGRRCERCHTTKTFANAVIR